MNAYPKHSVNYERSQTNLGSEAGQSDTTETNWGGSDTLSEWNDESAYHTSAEGHTGGSLLGPSDSKKYNDATGFVSEGRVETKSLDTPVEDTKLMRDLHPATEQRHSIERFLSRPVKIATITFSSQAAAGQILGSFDVIENLRNSARFRLAREKLSSFYGVHMRAHLKVTLNAQPMESGIFQIFFIPYQRTEGSVVAPLQFTSNFESMLPYTTGCPNIPCNISKQSEVELAMPYTGPVAFINLTNAQADFGRFFVQSIVPISDNTNNASCELSVYMYFTNVKLFGTTPNSIIATTQNLTAEGVEKCKPSESAEEQMMMPQPQVGNDLGEIVQDLAPHVLPLLAAIGASAPTANPNNKRVQINPYSSPATIDSTKGGLKLSYTFKHHLDIGSIGVNTQQDEMSLKTITSKPCYYNQFAWNTAQDADTLLYTYRVEPNCVLKNAANITAPTRLRFVANNFRYWKGSLRYHFMVAGNQYHSGRLRFVYSFGGPVPGTPSDNYPRTYSQIVDIRKGAHFTIDTPYMASTAWRVIPQIWNDGTNMYTNPVAGALDDVPGMLQVFVENELRSSQVTSTSVQIVCMVGAGPHFELACPIAPRSRPYINAAVPDGNVVARTQGLDFAPIDMMSGSIPYDKGSGSVHKFTVGESISSVRQLIKRYQLLGSGDVTPGNSTFILYPFAMIRPEGTPTLSYDHLGVFSTLYQFRRGSMRYMLIPSNPTKFLVRYDPEFAPADNPTVADGRPFGDRTPIRTVTAFPSGVTLENLNITATVPFDIINQGAMEIEIPYYSRFHKVKTTVFARDTLAADYANQIVEGRVPAGIVYFKQKTAANYTLDVLRCAADDFTLGYLLGAPFCQYRDNL